MESANQTVDLVQQSNLYKLTVSNLLEQKIRFMCSKSPDNEWSGVLFYTYEGSPEDNSLVIVAKDFVLMGLGTSGYTEFFMSAEVVNYMALNDLLDCQIGLVHSHHTMAAFFSGTDINTLKKEGSDRNNFVSLIVNNAGNYKAAITFKAKSKVTEEYSIVSFDKECTHTDTKDINVILYNYLEISFEGSNNNQFKDLEDRFCELKEEALNTPQKYIESTPSGNIKQLSLPLGDDYRNNRVESIADKNLIEELETDINNDTQTILKQILLGSVLANEASNKEVEDLAKYTPALYSKRFKNSENMRGWLELMVEFLLIDDNMKDVETTVWYLLQNIEEILDDSEFKHTLIDILHDYISNYS